MIIHIYKCDKCGKEAKKYDELVNIIVGSEIREYQLCDNCVREVMNFIKGGVE